MQANLRLVLPTVPAELLGFGRNYVQVRSLDEWTLYQYDLPFEQASAEQQGEALKHYPEASELQI